MESRSATSAVRANALPPPCVISSQTSRTSSPRRPAGTVLAPARASPTAIARPSPEVPPTTTATRPVSSVMFSTMFFCTPRGPLGLRRAAATLDGPSISSGRPDLFGLRLPCIVRRAQGHPRAEVAGEHARDIALDLRTGHGATALKQLLVGRGKRPGYTAARVRATCKSVVRGCARPSAAG